MSGHDSTADANSSAHVERRDRYTVNINGHGVRANEDQERRIRDLDEDAMRRFLRIMGKGGKR